MEDIRKWQSHLDQKSPQEILSWALNHFGPDKVALASSLGAEDQVLTDMLLSINPRARIFTLDTGRLPQETYDTIAETMNRYSMNFEILFPDTTNVEVMESEHSPNLFYNSIENRKLCCHVRKIEPLQRKLKTLDAWICGLRREQAVTRSSIEVIEWDDSNGLVKLNPLAEWTEQAIWDYISEQNVPYNKLHDQGYPSIGCAPCTRAVKPGEDLRAGRWWWETPDSKECGLHMIDGKLARKG